MSDARIEAAEARVARARSRLADALGALKERLMPGNLARSVASGIAEKSQDAAKAGVDVVKARPAAAIGIAAVAGLFFARKPIARALGSDEPSEPDATRKARRRSGKNKSAED